MLFNQFKYFFNLYFLLLACSQFINELRLGALYTYWVPLVCAILQIFAPYKCLLYYCGQSMHFLYLICVQSILVFFLFIFYLFPTNIVATALTHVKLVCCSLLLRKILFLILTFHSPGSRLGYHHHERGSRRNKMLPSG